MTGIILEGNESVFTMLTGQHIETVRRCGAESLPRSGPGFDPAKIGFVHLGGMVE